MPGNFQRYQRDLLAQGLAPKSGLYLRPQLADEVDASARLKRLQLAVLAVMQKQKLVKSSFAELYGATGPGCSCTEWRWWWG